MTTTAPSLVTDRSVPTQAARSGSAVTLAIVLVSYLMLMLDFAIIVTALPHVQDGLKFSTTGLSWVQNAYTLAFGGLLLIGARASDLFGHRRMLVTGLAVFTVASLGIGLALSPLWMITARVLQGAGAAVVAPSALTLLTTSFPAGRERARALGYCTATVGASTSLGPVLGGAFTDLLSWRVAFLVNVPIGIAAILAALCVLPRDQRLPGRFDLPGAVISCIAMTALVYGIFHSTEAGWADPITCGILTAGAALAVLFVLHQRRASQPIMPLSLFASPRRCGAYATRVLFVGAMVGFWFFTTQYLQSVLGLSPLQAGLAFLPTTVVNLVAALASARLTGLLGDAWQLALGLTISLIGTAWLALLSADTPYLAGVALPLTLIGLGAGIGLGPLTAASVADVDPADAGAASGVMNVAHQFGGTLGLALLITVYAAADSRTLHGTALLAHRIATTFAVASGMVALAVVLVITLLVRPGTSRSASRRTSCGR